MKTHDACQSDVVQDLGAATQQTQGIPWLMHDESTGEMDYRD